MLFLFPGLPWLSWQPNGSKIWKHQEISSPSVPKPAKLLCFHKHIPNCNLLYPNFLGNQTEGNMSEHKHIQSPQNSYIFLSIFQIRIPASRKISEKFLHHSTTKQTKISQKLQLQHVTIQYPNNKMQKLMINPNNTFAPQYSRVQEFQIMKNQNHTYESPIIWRKQNWSKKTPESEMGNDWMEPLLLATEENNITHRRNRTET